MCKYRGFEKIEFAAGVATCGVVADMLKRRDSCSGTPRQARSLSRESPHARRGRTICDRAPRRKRLGPRPEGRFVRLRLSRGEDGPCPHGLWHSRQASAAARTRVPMFALIERRTSRQQAPKSGKPSHESRPPVPRQVVSSRDTAIGQERQFAI